MMLNDPCLMSIPVDKDDRVNIVHTANALAKRLTVKVREKLRRKCFQLFLV